MAAGWQRLERPYGPLGELVLAVGLAVAPALARSWRLRLALLVAGALVVVRVALGASVLEARPFNGRHDFLGPLASRCRDGFLEFYDVRLPLDPAEHPSMHGMLLLATFGFCAALALAVAARRPVPAVLALLAGAGWPATLLAGGDELGRGALVLGGVLWLLAGLTGRVDRPAAAAAAGLILGALVVSSSPAVAKGQFLHWQRWDPYSRHSEPVSVRYVWDSDYGGIRFPGKPSTVLRIEAPRRSLYWRATTLDRFAGDRWVEELAPTVSAPLLAAEPRSSDPLLPLAGRRRAAWTRSAVTVAALRDDHLVGGSEPVAYDVRSLGRVVPAAGGVALVPGGLRRDDRYTAWSYAPSPSPAQLARSLPRYPVELLRDGRYLRVQHEIQLPPFGEPGRDETVAQLFRHPLLRPYAGVYRRARQIAGAPRTPYAAVVALEAWLRTSGDFAYDERPPRGGPEPALVAFVERTRRGYCQHFAGSMALMLRYLGIPARVAAGFTSGRYDAREGIWTVTDREAHTWVEVWFSGYGWLPFDPTPGRGELSGSYTTASPRFDADSVGQILALVARRAFGALDPKRGRARGDGASDATLAGGADARRGADPSGGRVRERGESLLRLLALAWLVLVATIVFAKTIRRWSGLLTRDPRRLAGACRRELADYLVDQRLALGLGRSATLHELGAAIEAELSVDPRAFVAAATAARFGPPERAGEAAVRARRELRAVRREIRRRRGRLHRLHGLLSLRSLGFAA